MNGRRLKERYRPVAERVKDYRPVALALKDPVLEQEGLRCLDCGTPFCHMLGCPLGNLIPEWNEALGQGRWYEAWRRLELTNNFPEITGRVCPAPCEASCTLAINSSPVAIRQVELAIIEKAFTDGWVVPRPPARETGRRVAVIGSGPAGLAAAQQLRRQGHEVTAFERDERIGGLLRFGIPDFKLEKQLLDRRLAQLEAEGVNFVTGVNVGVSLPAEELCQGFDAVLLAGGAQQPRDLNVPGRELSGIHFAMDYLSQQNRRCAGETIEPAQALDARGRHVLVLGGGDTGADCVGTALRQGAASVTSFELMPKPPTQRAPDNPWPEWPRVLRKASSHEEGGERHYNVLTRRLLSDGAGRVAAAVAVNVSWQRDARGQFQMDEQPDTAFTQPCDMVLLALGFSGPKRGGMLEQLGVTFTAGGAVATNEHKMTSRPGVFAAGDMSRGQSLVVWAIAEGRSAAEGINRFLMED
jgi:glutamate synthase (NADPH) small chain